MDPTIILGITSVCLSATIAILNLVMCIYQSHDRCCAPTEHNYDRHHNHHHNNIDGLHHRTESVPMDVLPTLTSPTAACEGLMGGTCSHHDIGSHV